MVIRVALLFFGILLGVSFCVITNVLERPTPMTATPIQQGIRLKDGDGFSVRSDPYGVLMKKEGDRFDLILFKDGKERVGINAEAETIKLQSSYYDQGLKVMLLDNDGDGIPDMKIYSREDGTSVKTQLFFNGDFQDAHPGEKGWVIGTTSVVFKEHKWQPAESSDQH
jgi:hypothetical protein